MKLDRKSTLRVFGAPSAALLSRTRGNFYYTLCSLLYQSEYHPCHELDRRGELDFPFLPIRVRQSMVARSYYCW